MSTATNMPLVEYDDPDVNRAARDMEVEKYIEAETGKEFYIQVKLKKGLKYHGADGFKIRYEMDEGRLLRYRTRKREGRKIALPQDRSVEFKDSPVKSGDEWECIRFSFGSVTVGESTPTNGWLQPNINQTRTVIPNKMC